MGDIRQKLSAGTKIAAIPRMNTVKPMVSRGQVVDSEALIERHFQGHETQHNLTAKTLANRRGE